MQRLDLSGLPADPVAAAAAYHSCWLPRALALLTDDLTLIFPPADHSHKAWRIAAVQGLARRAVPYRVSGVAGEGALVVDAALRFIAAAPGVTGQYLTLDGSGAGIMINPAE